MLWTNSFRKLLKLTEIRDSTTYNVPFHSPKLKNWSSTIALPNKWTKVRLIQRISSSWLCRMLLPTDNERHRLHLFIPSFQRPSLPPSFAPPQDQSYRIEKRQRTVQHIRKKSRPKNFWIIHRKQIEDRSWCSAPWLAISTIQNSGTESAPSCSKIALNDGVHKCRASFSPNLTPTLPCDHFLHYLFPQFYFFGGSFTLGTDCICLK